MSYGEALERLEILPFYCDVDTFIEKAALGSLPSCDAAFSLNAGVRPVSNFALVPAVAQWYQIPVVPCTADVIMAGERKDLANAIAVRAGLRVPRTYKRVDLSEARSERFVLVKPRDLGGSYGLQKLSGEHINDEDFQGGKIVQRFIPGYDVTVPVFTDATCGAIVVGDATVYFPSNADPASWIYDRDAKDAYVGGEKVTSVVRHQFPLDECARKQVIDLCSAIGVDCFARIDFRIELTTPDGLSEVTADRLYFIEINPMPTVCTGLAFIESLRSWAKRSFTDGGVDLAPGLNPDDDYDLIAYVLAHALSGQLGPIKMNNRDQIGS
jgi:D-alanine-D-alanine ligase-like ATP-grasp enzyme